VAKRLGFEVVLDPRTAGDPMLAALTAADTLDGAIARSPLDISPPTDDRPFFFHTVPLGRALRFAATDQGNVSFNIAAVLVLVGGVAVAVGFTGASLAGLAAIRRRHPDDGAVQASDAIFFAAIGLGYVLVEISELERLTMFLGHPTLGLVVVLFGLLLSSGAGSFAVGRWPLAGPRAARAAPLLIIPAVLLASGALTTAVLPALWRLETSWRILIALALLAPIGLVMGTAFPRGLELAKAKAPAATPWLWAINGAASVLGSLAAVLVSISAGISAAFWSGTAAYVLAAAAGLRMAGPVSSGPGISSPLVAKPPSRLPTARWRRPRAAGRP
jgi:hypothetical protein